MQLLAKDCTRCKYLLDITILLSDNLLSFFGRLEIYCLFSAVEKVLAETEKITKRPENINNQPKFKAALLFINLVV